MKKDKYGDSYKDGEATLTFDLLHDDGEYTYAMLILKDEHYLGKGEFEEIKAVIEDAFWLDFTFFICYNKGRICEETYRFAKFNEYIKWEMIDRLRF
jgi:tryptophanase